MKAPLLLATGLLATGLLAVVPLAAVAPGALADEPQAEAACLSAPRSQAVPACEAALAARPGDLALRRKLAWSYLASYRETDALALLAAIAEERPDDAAAQFDLAAAAAGLRDYPRALAALRVALRLAPGELRILRLGARLYEETGAPAAAFALHRRLALAGQPIGMFDLAEDYAQGRGTEPNQQHARTWYTRAAEAGHVMAMTVLAAKLDSRAFGTAPDPDGAAFWRRRAEEATRD